MDGLHHSQVEINEFADLSNEEFRRMHTGLKIKPVTEHTYLLAGSYNQTYVNWAENGHSVIRDQGQCGSCYTFSTTAVLEDLYFKQFGQKLDFSEQ